MIKFEKGSKIMKKFELGQEVTMYMFYYDEENNSVEVHDSKYIVAYVEETEQECLDSQGNVKTYISKDYTFMRDYYSPVNYSDLYMFKDIKTPYYSLEYNAKVIKEYTKKVKKYFLHQIQENVRQINVIKEDNELLKRTIASLKGPEL